MGNHRKRRDRNRQTDRQTDRQRQRERESRLAARTSRSSPTSTRGGAPASPAAASTSPASGPATATAASGPAGPAAAGGVPQPSLESRSSGSPAESVGTACGGSCCGAVLCLLLLRRCAVDRPLSLCLIAAHLSHLDRPLSLRSGFPYPSCRPWRSLYWRQWESHCTPGKEEDVRDGQGRFHEMQNLHSDAWIFTCKHSRVWLYYFQTRVSWTSRVIRILDILVSRRHMLR
jgi:hypothetical protein